jgi:hypothetical protein
MVRGVASGVIYVLRLRNQCLLNFEPHYFRTLVGGGHAPGSRNPAVAALRNLIGMKRAGKFEEVVHV